MIFLQQTTLLYQGNPFPEALIGLIAAFLFIFVVLLIGIYVYSSLAFMAIARKARYKSPAIAWIPFVGPLIVTSSIAKMHWWPILLIIPAFIPVIGTLASLALCVFSLIWLWKTYEKVGKPGWWSLFMIIPLVGLIFLGIVAWSKK